jgi:hypothetical protein
LREHEELLRQATDKAWASRSSRPSPAAHGGSAEARLDAPHGLRVTLTLPAAPVLAGALAG